MRKKKVFLIAVFSMMWTMMSALGEASVAAILVYPNPASEYLTITGAEEGEKVAKRYEVFFKVVCARGF